MSIEVRRLALIVEGHGEVESCPVLVRRIAQELGRAVQVLHPIRVPKSRLLRPGEMERALELALRKLQGFGAIMVLLDADDDCVKVAGVRELIRARRHVHLPVAVVYAVREYEAWFLAGLEALQGRRQIRAGVDAPQNPESISGAKEYLQRCLEPGRHYAETVDQPALTQLMDLDLVRTRSRSFDKFWRELERLLG